MRNLMYSFVARTRHKDTITGLISARSANFAHHRIKKTGMSHIRIKLNVLESVSELLGAKPDQRQLSTFYRIVGQRLQNGEGRIQAALEQAQTFLLDGRLKSMVAMFHAGLDDGQEVATAMTQAGFDQREAMVVKALSDGAERGQAFLSLSEEVESREDLRRRFTVMLRTPKFMLGFAYVMLPGYIFLLAPKIEKFFGQLGGAITMPGSVTSFYQFIDVLRGSPIVFAVGFLLLPIGLKLLLGSSWFKSQLERIPIVRNVSEKRDHITLWHAFALMYRGRIPQGDALRTLGRSAARAETRRSIAIAAKRLSAGADEVSAISNAGFPTWVVAGFRGAKLSGDLADGLLRFTVALKQDLTFAMDNLAHVVDKVALVFMALIVLVFFFITVYPMTAPVLASL